MKPFMVLLLAIAAEVIGTTALKMSDGMTRLIPTLVVVAGYGMAFWMLSIAIRTIPVGVSYAIWAGIGTVGITIIGILMFQQKLNPISYIGIALIIAGTVILNISMKTAH